MKTNNAINMNIREAGDNLYIDVQNANNMIVCLSDMGRHLMTAGKGRMPKKTTYIKVGSEAEWDALNAALDAVYTTSVEAFRAAAYQQRAYTLLRATEDAVKADEMMQQALRNYCNLLGVRTRGEKVFKNVLFVNTEMTKVFTPWLTTGKIGRFKSRETFVQKFVPVAWYVIGGMDWEAATEAVERSEAEERRKKAAEKKAAAEAEEAKIAEQLSALEADNAEYKSRLEAIRAYVKANEVLDRAEVMAILGM